jgi:hypothetical protein
MRKLLLLLFIPVLLFSCKKDQKAPDLVFKTGPTYTSSDIVASPGTTIVVGCTATKTDDDLHLFYTEVAYDGSNTSALVSRTYMAADQKSTFTQDVTITLRNTPGTERWIFLVNDADGRITKKEIRVTVQ